MALFKIVDPRRIEVADASRLEYRERGGNLRRALGLAAILLGLGFLAGLLRMQASWPLLDAVLNPLLGAGLLAGGFATFVDLGVVLDSGAGTVVHWWGIVFPLRKTTRNPAIFSGTHTPGPVRLTCLSCRRERGQVLAIDRFMTKAFQKSIQLRQVQPGRRRDLDPDCPAVR